MDEFVEGGEEGGGIGDEDDAKHYLHRYYKLRRRTI